MLAPLRNVHKFDPIIRLPLVLGLAFVIDRVFQARTMAPKPAVELQHQLEGINRFALLAMVMVGLVGATVPALEGRTGAGQPSDERPGVLAGRGEVPC